MYQAWPGLARRKVEMLFRQFDGLNAAANRGVRVGGQHQGRIVQQADVVGMSAEQLAPLGQHLQKFFSLGFGVFEILLSDDVVRA